MTETEQRISQALFEFFGSDDVLAGILLNHSSLTMGEVSELADRVAVWIADGGAMRAAARIQ